MATKEFVLKLREERIAKEKARIQKLRELNLKKYGQSETNQSIPAVSLPLKSKSTTTVRNTTTTNPISNPNNLKALKNVQPKPLAQRVSTAPNITTNKVSAIRQSSIGLTQRIQKNPITKTHKNLVPPKSIPTSIRNNNTKYVKNNSNVQKNNLTTVKPKEVIQVPKADGNNRESVFDRLYKPKIIHKPSIDEAQKLRNDPSFLKKILSSSNLITSNRRCTTFEVKTKEPTRRSLSAVHLKKISRSEAKNCIHKWPSVGEKLHKKCLKDISEDDNTHDDIVSAVKSERKKVKFQTPMHNPEEMLSKLNKWLHLRGKSIDAYPHLKCFGVSHTQYMPNYDDDDENKENIALDHDSDNESFIEMNGNNKTDMDKWNNKLEMENWNSKDMEKWRSPSCVDSVDFNDSYQTTMTCEMSPREDELLLGALNHLTELLRIGYNWEECARWLRAIRERYTQAQDTAAYWECRAALEERRGNLPVSLQCWEEAIAKGAESSRVEASLDQLLDKFMQLKINPGSSKKPVDPKLVDAKNVFKSTLIRFAVQEAKNNLSASKATVTPVRRSTRLSVYHKQTPIKLFKTIRQAIESEQAEFKPNRMISGTP